MLEENSPFCKGGEGDLIQVPGIFHLSFQRKKILHRLRAPRMLGSLNRSV